MKILVCGDRNWDDRSYLFRSLANYIFPFNKSVVTIIHGGCRGADQMAGEFARKNNCREIEVRADWKKYGKKAGPIRNALMLREHQPDVVIAFHKDLSKSRGTSHMVSIARMRGVPVLILPEGMPWK